MPERSGPTLPPSPECVWHLRHSFLKISLPFAGSPPFMTIGESAWMTFWRVTFPIALPGIVASLLMCFTISFDEFVMAFFLSGTDQTLPVFLYSQLRFPNKLPPTLSLGSSILAASIVIVIVSEWLRRRGVQTSKPGAF